MSDESAALAQELMDHLGQEGDEYGVDLNLLCKFIDKIIWTDAIRDHNLIGGLVLFRSIIYALVLDE